VSVDGLFSRDGWETTIVQPAFYFQPYQHTQRDRGDHFTPSGPAIWALRFTPQQPGAWQCRLRAVDVGGTTYYPAMAEPPLSFTVAEASTNPGSAYRRRGFLRVSRQDPRYFELQDDSPFLGVGFNDGFNHSAEVAQKLQAYEQNKMNFMRVWLSGASINGSQWSSWASQLSNDGYLPGVSLDIQETYAGSDVSMRLDAENRCFFADFWQNGIPVEPEKEYTVWARVKLSGISGPAGPGQYGFVIKQGGWLEDQCDQPDAGRLITQSLSGTQDWTIVSGSFTTQPGQYWLDYLYLARQNVTSGEIYIDEVRLWRTADPHRVNLLREPNANSHLHFDPMNAAKWDLFIEAAERHGVYLKLVIDEKNEWIRNHMRLDGSMAGSGDNNNFYAAPNSKSRWLQRAWWRYLIARWGYSTAIHSFEYINEGDPYNGHHYEAANGMARYFHQNDPSHHLVTTSFWTSFPNAEFWSNPQFQDVDYADLHAYISTGWGANASFLEASQIETRPQYVHSGNASAILAGAKELSTAITPRGLVIQGRGEWIVRYWMKAEGFMANCSFGSQGGMQRVRWMLDGGEYWGGKEGVVPNNTEGKDFLCTSQAGTYGWTQFNSDRDRNGVLLPAVTRLILADDLPHEISLHLENSSGVAGNAWIDDVELVDPSGQVVPIIGEFDITPFDEDTAWFNRAYGELFGGGSLVGARMPLVRGETGIDSWNEQVINPELSRDTEGIWLHNNLWGQVNPGGMYELFWWASETISPSLFDNYLTFSNFMEGIPFNNGNYRDLGAQTSHTKLRVWGQRDDLNGQMYLWIQNLDHTWKRVIDGSTIEAVSGTVTIPGVAPGRYRIQWWHTYRVENPQFLVQEVASNGSLVVELPAPLVDDVAAKIERLP